MTTDLGRIAIFGAGSIGCYVGGLLRADGHDVCFLGRERTVQTFGEFGLHLTSHEGIDRTIVPNELVVSSDPAIISGCDVVLVCVKSQDTPQAAASIAGQIAPHCTVVSLQNGVENAPLLTDELAPNAVVAGMVGFNVVSAGKGHFHRATGGEIILQNTPVGQALAAALSRAGIETRLDADMKSVAWGKLLLNLNNALNALSDVPLVQQLSDRSYRLVLADMIAEALRATNKAGIKPATVGGAPPKLIPLILRLPNWLFLKVAKSMIAMDSEARSSMWDDLSKGRQPEIDFLNGAVVALAKRVGTEAPVNSAITRMVKDAFEQKSSPGLTGDALLAKLSQESHQN